MGLGRCRWERSQLAKAVTKMLAGGEPKALASAPTLLKALALLPDGQERGVHPHHFALPLDAEAKSLLGARTSHSLLGGQGSRVMACCVHRSAPAPLRAAAVRRGQVAAGCAHQPLLSIF